MKIIADCESTLKEVEINEFCGDIGTTKGSATENAKYLIMYDIDIYIEIYFRKIGVNPKKFRNFAN